MSLHRISINNRFGLINEYGDVVVEPIFFGIGDETMEGLVASLDGNNYGVIDMCGNFIIPSVYEALGAHFSCGLLPAKSGGKFGFINQGGDVIIDFQFDAARLFVEGMACVLQGQHYYFINKAGITKSTQFDSARFFSCGLAGVTSNGKMGYIDHDGELLIPHKYDPSQSLNFKDDFAGVVVNDRAGLIDKAGDQILPICFLGCRDVSEGITLIRTHDMQWSYCFIPSMHISEGFEDATNFNNSRAAVRVGKRWLLIDPDMNKLAAIDCDKVAEFVDGYSIIEKEGKDGVINAAGTILVPPIYDNLNYASGGLWKFVRNCTSGYVDSSGREVWRTHRK